jgi:glycosyltransferase involved in cell wall biosynthesis
VNPEKPLFSIIICTKNREKHLSLCLDSILLDLAQSLIGSYEIIIVGGIEEKSAGIISNVLKKYEIMPGNLHYIMQDRTGLPNARNCGLRKAHGKIIVFFDDDVVVNTGYFNELDRIFSSEKRTGGVSGVYQKSLNLYPRMAMLKISTDRLFLGGCSGENGPIGKVLQSGFTTSNFEYADKLTEVNRLTGCNMAFSEHAIKKRFFDENYVGGVGIGEDADYSYRVEKAGFSLFVDPKLQIMHEDVEDKFFPYSECHLYYFALNHTYFFFKEVYDAKANSLVHFVIGSIYYSFLHLVGSTACSRPSIGFSFLRGLLSGLHHSRAIIEVSNK